MLSSLLSLQLSQTTWPGRAIQQNFYDHYIAGRSYEEHYRIIFEQATNIRKRRELSDEITDHFLAVHVYVETVAALDIRDKPQVTATSFLSQLGGALNLWAGITVVVVIEMIEFCYHYIDVIMTTMTFQITSLTVVYSTVYSGVDQRKHQSSASLAFVWGIHRDR